MNDKQKNNPFLTPEMKNLIDSLNKITDSYSGYFQTIFHSDLMNYQIAQLQEEIVKPYRQLFRLYTPSMVASFTESLSKMSDIITTTIRENITIGVYNNLNESLKQSLSLLELQKQFLNLPPELHSHSDFWYLFLCCRFTLILFFLFPLENFFFFPVKWLKLFDILIDFFHPFSYIDILKIIESNSFS